jgi:voltage-gated potassium channel
MSLTLPHRESPPYLVFMLVLSVLALVSLAMSASPGIDPELRSILRITDDAVCVVFFLDFLVALYTAPDRWRYLRTWGWLDLLSAVPMVDSLRVTRLGRILRIIRIIRAIKATKFMVEFVVVRRAEHAFLSAVLLSMVLVVFAAIGMLHFEVGSAANIRTGEDALWWALATITTVGYGDRYPVSPEGRAIAAALMVGGVGLFGMLSGFVASWFLKPQEKSRDSDVAKLVEEVRLLRESVDAMKGAR